MDLSGVCRTCLSGDTLTPIFKTNYDNDAYSNIIYVATGVQIYFNDNLPQNICVVCKNKLNDILKFRKQCKNIETKLLSLLPEEKPIIIGKYTQNYTQNTTINSLKNNFNDYDPDCIKPEYKEKETKSTDIEDDKPLNQLLDSQPPKIEVCCLEKEIDTANCETKTESSNIDIFEEDITDIEAKNDFNDTKMNNSNDTENKSTEPPYELITDPVTQKATRVFCKLCNKELSIRSIDSHMTRRHPGADERKVKCDLCDNYIMKQKLNRHMVMMHGGHFKCGYCKSEFKNREELIDHVSSCTAKKRKRKVNESGRELSECDICHKVMQKASLRMHKAVKHAGLRPVCEHCGKTFGNKFRLNEHCRAKHGYEKFQCSYCDFRSASAMAMRNHERRHRGEKPFICEACGAKFHAAYLLAQHKHSHRTEKLVKCDLCPASFKAKNSLHMHKLTCHSSASYRCAVCRRSYKCRHYAVKHARHVHRYIGSRNDDVVVMTT